MRRSTSPYGWPSRGRRSRSISPRAVSSKYRDPEGKDVRDSYRDRGYGKEHRFDPRDYRDSYRDRRDDSVDRGRDSREESRDRRDERREKKSSRDAEKYPRDKSTGDSHGQSKESKDKSRSKELKKEKKKSKKTAEKAEKSSESEGGKRSKDKTKKGKTKTAKEKSDSNQKTEKVAMEDKVRDSTRQDDDRPGISKPTITKSETLETRQEPDSSTPAQEVAEPEREVRSQLPDTSTTETVTSKESRTSEPDIRPHESKSKEEPCLSGKMDSKRSRSNTPVRERQRSPKLSADARTEEQAAKVKDESKLVCESPKAAPDEETSNERTIPTEEAPAVEKIPEEKQESDSSKEPEKKKRQPSVQDRLGPAVASPDRENVSSSKADPTQAGSGKAKSEVEIHAPEPSKWEREEYRDSSDDQDRRSRVASSIRKAQEKKSLPRYCVGH